MPFVCVRVCLHDHEKGAFFRLRARARGADSRFRSADCARCWGAKLHLREVSMLEMTVRKVRKDVEYKVG